MSITLSEHDHILAAYAEPASGPGWSNTPIWVIVRSRYDGAIRLECIQPQEQSAEMQVLYRVSSAAHEAMTHWVRRAAKPAETA